MLPEANNQRPTLRHSRITNPDLVHDGRHNDHTPAALPLLRQGIPPPRNGYPMSVRVHVLPDDMILAANQNARWPIKPIRLGILTSGH